jgi:probable phosphoglycerate mutase
LDSALTEAGIRQARLVAEALRSRGIQAIYSSDLGRAVQTAEIIGEALDLEVRLDSRLRERNLGPIQGMSRDEIHTQFPEHAALVDSTNPDHALPEGESARQHYERCVKAATELAARHPGGSILIVAHGGVLRSYFFHAIGINLTEPRRFSIFNAAINSFSINGDTWHLDTWGDISHLNGMNVLDEL